MQSAGAHNKFWHALLPRLWEEKQLADGVLHHCVHAKHDTTMLLKHRAQQ